MYFAATVHSFCVLSMVLAAVPLSAQDLDWGRKMFDKREVKFGSVAKNADVVFRFNVKNIYKEDINVSSLTTSCGCISWQEKDKTPLTIPSGQTRELTIRLDTIRHSGDKHVTAFATLVEPTRGSTASISIPVEGRIREDVVLQTNNLNFGQVEQGKAMVIRMNVTYTGGRPDWAITKALVNSKYLTSKVIEKSRSGGTATYEVVVTLNGDAPPSKLHEQMLIVSNDYGDAGYGVSVDAQIEPDVMVADAQFGQVTPGHPKTVNVVIRGKKAFKIEKIERTKQNESFKVKTTDNLSTVHMVPLTFTPTVENGLFEEEFFLTISGREQPLTFKAKGRVMDQSVTVSKPVAQP